MKIIYSFYIDFFKNTVTILLLLISSSLYSEDFMPKKLDISPDLKKTLIVKESKNDELGMICSLSNVDGNHLFFCNYREIYSLDKTNGKLKRLIPSKDVDKFYPTGLHWNNVQNALYVANYIGKDILVFRLEDNKLILQKKITDKDMIGPENIVVSKDGDSFAVADYDSSKLHYFKNNKKIWSVDVGRAHGVAFSDDEQSIYVSGLIPAKLYKYDLSGELEIECGRQGWGKSGYMWPTSISVNNDTLYVADAHTGKITLLNQSLEPINTFGGNGLGLNLYNMPYGVNVHENSLYISDTFKSRILKQDIFSGSILAIYNEHECNILPAFAAMGTHHNDQKTSTDKSYKISFGDNFPEVNSSWFPSYNAFVSGQKNLYLLGTMPVFTSGNMYWIYAKEISIGERKYLIFGSPQVREWLIHSKGYTIPIKLDLNYWLLDDGLYNDYKPKIEFQDLITHYENRILHFRAMIKDGISPLEALAKILLGQDKTFQDLKQIFYSNEGKLLFTKLQSAEKFTNHIADYLVQINDSNNLYFPELTACKMLYDHSE